MIKIKKFFGVEPKDEVVLYKRALLLGCKNVIIYGAGVLGYKVFALCQNNQTICVKYFADIRAKTSKLYVGHYKVITPQHCFELDDCDAIIVASVVYEDEILLDLKAYFSESNLLNACNLVAMSGVHVLARE